MKRLLLILVTAFITLSASSQIQQYRTQAFSYKQQNYDWSDWEESNMLVIFDFSTDIVTIYSPTTQYYQIISQPQSGYDSDGEGYVKFRFIDQDGDQGTLKLMIRNITWCYVVRRI